MGLLVRSFLRCGSSGCPQAQDALHLGRYGPEEQLRSEFVAALSVDVDSGMSMAGFAGFFFCIYAVFLQLAAGP